MDDHIKSLLKSYEQNRDRYQAFGTAVHSLLKEILLVEGVQVVSLSYRTKAPESLEEKARRIKYATVEDVPDLVGIRIVTYFATDTSRVANLILRDFRVQQSKTLRGLLSAPGSSHTDPTHMLCALSDSHLSSPKYQPFAGMKFEIQMRSLLQEAWATIQHDLGYKVAEEIPQSLHKHFLRVAAMLEIADDEFSRLQAELLEYTGELRKSVSQHPNDVALNAYSMRAFIANDSLVKRLDEAVAEASQSGLVAPKDPWVEARLRQLEIAGITTVGQLGEALTRCQDKISPLGKLLFGSRNPEAQRPNGVSIYLLLPVLAAHSRSLEDTIAVFDKMLMFSSEERRERAGQIRAIVNRGS